MNERKGVAASLRATLDAIATAASARGRDPNSVRLIGVTKTVPPDVVEDAISAGQRLFGENRVQEATAKWPELKERYPDLELHLVGPLQSNKVRDAVQLFDAIHSVDRPKIARALGEEMQRSGKRPQLLVQVIEGLMCIPPFDDEPSMHFALLAKLAREAGLSELSMGMSGDFEKAITFGATYVRIGTAIFGGRDASEDD
jgi:uncharacterized pyridoxal phosphate-containing UPF0001 family protein